LRRGVPGRARQVRTEMRHERRLARPCGLARRCSEEGRAPLERDWDVGRCDLGAQVVPAQSGSGGWSVGCAGRYAAVRSRRGPCTHARAHVPPVDRVVCVRRCAVASLMKRHCSTATQRRTHTARDVMCR
jgi:hypothetical protein